MSLCYSPSSSETLSFSFAFDIAASAENFFSAMEIPIINRMSNFDDPSFLSRLFPIIPISQPFSLWKWGALILALLATFTSIINRIKTLILRLRQRGSLAAQQLLSEPDDDGFSESEDESCSSISSNDEDAAAEPPFPIEDEQNGRVGYCGDEPQSNRTGLRRRRSIGDRISLLELTSGRSVVKLWDGSSLDNPHGCLSIYDLSKDPNVSSFLGGTYLFPAVSMASPAVVISAMTENAKNTALRLWDARVSRQIPAMFAEWRPQIGKRVSVGTGGTRKVYVRDEDTGEFTVGDLRNVSSPLQNVTDKTW